jgi:ATP-binding cassette subfamily B protein
MPESSTSLLLKSAAFLKPYKKQISIAAVALVFTAALTLGLVQYVRIIVDSGFVEGSTEALNTAVLGFFFIAIFQAVGTFARFYWVSWLGERVTADIRKAVYAHIIKTTSVARFSRASLPIPHSFNPSSDRRLRLHCVTY